MVKLKVDLFKFYMLEPLLYKRYFFNLKFCWLFNNFNYMLFLDGKQKKPAFSVGRHFGFLTVTSKNFLGIFKNHPFFYFLKGEFSLIYFNKEGKFFDYFREIKEHYYLFGFLFRKFFLQSNYLPSLDYIYVNFLKNYNLIMFLLRFAFIFLFKIFFFINCRFLFFFKKKENDN